MTIPLDPAIKRLHATSSGALVDKAGSLKAAEADINEQIEAIKLELVRRGVTEESGDLFRATLTPPGERTTFDKAALEADCGPQFVAKYTKTTMGTSHTLRVFSRKRRAKASIAA